MPPQPEELTNILEICNVVFTSMFALEMLLKLAAFGLFDYLRNPYNIFDSIIVIIRCCPCCQRAGGPEAEWGGGAGKSSALSPAGKQSMSGHKGNQLRRNPVLEYLQICPPVTYGLLD